MQHDKSVQIKKGTWKGVIFFDRDSGIIDDKKNVSISSLVRNKYQPRKKFDEVSLEELTNSIRERYNPTNNS